MNLLTEEEVHELRPVLELLREKRGGVLDRWHALYLHHFGHSPCLDRAAFDDLFGQDLDALVDNLIEVDFEGFEADVTAVGHRLIEAGVTFAEVVASLHLLEESAGEQFRPKVYELSLGSNVYQSFDKLSHCRMILLANAYYAGREAEVDVRLHDLEEEAARLAPPAERSALHGLVGASQPMRQLYKEIAAASGGLGAILIAGESGTGKELIARAVHESAGSLGRPFVPLNCAALPRELIESELFGYGKGAYTGARAEHLGLIRAAAGGTLFLDEVTEMAPETQAKLLRVLEEYMVRPVGTLKEIPVRVRFVASTNRDPEKAVEAGLLRKDLYHRLNVFRLTVPPLRSRAEDVPAIAGHFLALFAGRGLRQVTAIDGDALAILQRYSWPGNVRELRNAIEHALAGGSGNRIALADLPPHVVRGARPSSAPGAAPVDQIPTMEEAEGALIRRALIATDGNKQQAARLLRISRHRLYDRLRKLGLES